MEALKYIQPLKVIIIDNDLTSLTNLSNLLKKECPEVDISAECCCPFLGLEAIE